MDAKTKYRAFCESRNDVPVFRQPWWLDAVCRDGTWGVCVTEKDGIITGALPYFRTKRWGISIITLPPLTPHTGVQFADSGREEALSVIRSLVRQLPRATVVRLYHPPGFKMLAPFEQRGFRTMERYTYQLDLTAPEPERLFNTNLRRKLKRARQTGLVCQESDDPDIVFSLNAMSLRRQGVRARYDRELFRRLDEAIQMHAGRKIFITYDTEGTPLAGGYYVQEDRRVVYYLTGGHNGHPTAMSLVMATALEYYQGRAGLFDFEGSMVPGIARFFRSFGGQPVAYYATVKYGVPLLGFLARR